MAKFIDERGDIVSTADTNRAERLTATEARQGALGKPVLVVLVCGLVLAFLAWGGAELWGEHTAPDQPAAIDTSTTSATTPGQPTGEGTFDNNAPAGEIQQMSPVDKDPTADSSTGGQSQQTNPDGTVK